MSNSYDVFIKNVNDFNAIRTVVTNMFNVDLKQENILGTWSSTCLYANIHIIIVENHDIEDDLNINFSDYRTMIGFKRYAGRDVHIINEICRNFSMLTADIFNRIYSYDCMIVEDMQSIIKKLTS